MTAATATCTVTDEVEVLTTEVTPIDLGPDIELCDGEIAVLDAGCPWLQRLRLERRHCGSIESLRMPSKPVPMAADLQGTDEEEGDCPQLSSDTLVVLGCGEGIGLGMEETLPVLQDETDGPHFP